MILWILVLLIEHFNRFFFKMEAYLTYHVNTISGLLGNFPIRSIPGCHDFGLEMFILQRVDSESSRPCSFHSVMHHTPEFITLYCGDIVNFYGILMIHFLNTSVSSLNIRNRHPSLLGRAGYGVCVVSWKSDLIYVLPQLLLYCIHYIDVIITTMTSQITSLNRLFRRRSKKTSKLRVTGLCVGNSPGLVNSPQKGTVTRKMFPFDDVIMQYSDIVDRVVTVTDCIKYVVTYTFLIHCPLGIVTLILHK